MSEEKDTFGSRVRRVREARRLTQSQVAKFCGVERAAVTRWEMDIRNPRGRTLSLLLEAIGTTPFAVKSGRGPLSLEEFEKVLSDMTAAIEPGEFMSEDAHQSFLLSEASRVAKRETDGTNDRREARRALSKMKAAERAAAILKRKAENAEAARERAFAYWTAKREQQWRARRVGTQAEPGPATMVTKSLKVEITEGVALTFDRPSACRHCGSTVAVLSQTCARCLYKSWL